MYVLFEVYFMDSSGTLDESNASRSLFAHWICRHAGVFPGELISMLSVLIGYEGDEGQVFVSSGLVCLFY